jgi:hypothetical protein
MARKLKHVEESQVINKQTGEVEVITKTKSFAVQSSSEEFFMTFIGNLSGFFKITRGSDIKVLAKLCTVAEYNTGKVVLSTNMRQDMLADLGNDKPMSQQYFTNCLRRLKDLGLISGKGNDWEINPQIFWKGSTDARRKLLEDEGVNIRIKFAPKIDENDK